MYVCSSKNLENNQSNLKSICQSFAGTSQPLTFLREKLKVKDFVHLLNCFPKLKNACGDIADGGENSSHLDYREIMIFFDDDGNPISPKISHESTRAKASSSSNDFSSQFCSENDSFSSKSFTNSKDSLTLIKIPKKNSEKIDVDSDFSSDDEEAEQEGQIIKEINQVYVERKSNSNKVSKFHIAQRLFIISLAFLSSFFISKLGVK